MSLSLYRRKGRKNYYLRGTVRGEAIFETTDTDSKEHAEAIRIKRETELLDRHVFGAKKTATFLEAAVSYLESGGEARFLGSFDEETGQWSLLIGHFYTKRLAEIDQAAIDRAAAVLYPGCKPSTISRQVHTPMAAVMHHAAKSGLCDYLVIEKPKVAAPAPDWADPHWFKEFWPHCTDKLRALTHFLLFTGCRVSEALALAPDDVDLSEGWAYIRKTKNEDPRAVHLTPPLIVELANLSWGDKQVFEYSSRWSVGNEIDRAIDKANKDRAARRLPPIKRLTSHQIGSHSYGTWMRRYGGLDTRGLVGTGRWKDARSADRYTHTTVPEEATKSNAFPDIKWDKKR